MMTLGNPCLCCQNIQRTLEKFLLCGQIFDHNSAQQETNALGKIVNLVFTVIIVYGKNVEAEPACNLQKRKSKSSKTRKEINLYAFI